MGSDSFAIGVRLLFGNAAVCNDSMRRSRPDGDIDSRMPRPPRIIRAGQTLHLVQRGNNRTACFTCDQDRAYFAHLLRRIGERTGCALHAYVLMTNHVHLLLTVSEARSPSRLMQMLGRRYVRYFNDRVERTGTLWEGRFRSSVIDSERYFFQCSRYIEMNPVRAGLAMRPVDYPWSSYRCNALGAFDGLVTTHPLYRALGDHDGRRRDAYRALFASPLDPDVVEDVRMATRRGTAPAVEAQRRAQMSHAAGPRFAGESDAVIALVETYRTASVAPAGL